MKPVIRLYICDDESEKFFGEGPYRLLLLTEKTGSLRAAAISMNMAYTKAHAIIDRAEKQLGFKLTQRKIGGKGGGGSCLTDNAKELISRYEKFKTACNDACLKYYNDIFLQNSVKVGCVIMASGFSRRFGSNKLLSDFGGKRLIDYPLDLTDTPFINSRIVITRYSQIEDICKQRDIECVLHSHDFQSDTVREGITRMQDTDGCMFLHADQPLLSHESMMSLISEFKSNPDSICRLAYGDIKASPVIFPKAFYGELSQISGENGGSAVIKYHSDCVRTVQAQNEYELADIDTPQQLDILKEFIK